MQNRARVPLTRLLCYACLLPFAGFSVVLGLLGALDTLCGQAWGAKQYRQLGVHLQRALLTTLGSCTAVALLWLHVEPLLLLVGQHGAIAAGAARFLRL